MIIRVYFVSSCSVSFCCSRVVYLVVRFNFFRHHVIIQIKVNISRLSICTIFTHHLCDQAFFRLIRIFIQVILWC